MRKMSATSSARFDTRTRSSGQALHVLKRAGDIAQRLCRDMGVTRRRAQLGMPEQHLDHTHIGVRFQQMRGKAVSQRVQCCGLFDPGHTLG